MNKCSDENLLLADDSVDRCLSEIEMESNGGTSQAEMIITELRLQIDTLKAQIFQGNEDCDDC
jgi:hypothetical protein